MKMPAQVNLMLRLHELEIGGSDKDIEEDLRQLGKRIDPALLNFYRKLRKRKKTGVAILQNCTCSECRMVYPATHDILRHKNCVQVCEFCGRILIVKDEAA
jgi:predicted  nucleic acid-binding Zn-ribbon protein